MKDQHKYFYRNRLPHWTPADATLFITFRLGDSLPQSMLQTLKEEYLLLKKSLELHPDNDIALKRLNSNLFQKYETQLEKKPYGNCYLKHPRIAEIVREKLHHLDQEKYHLHAYCIMPNHVHILFSVGTGSSFCIVQKVSDTPLHKIMQSIKGGTAFSCNKTLNRKGTFWEKESYDRVVRNKQEFFNVINYIRENPVKAGLVRKWEEFPHTYVNENLAYLYNQDDQPGNYD